MYWNFDLSPPIWNGLRKAISDGGRAAQRRMKGTETYRTKEYAFAYRSWPFGMNHLWAHIGYHIPKWSLVELSYPYLFYRRHI